ncbi:DUF3568 family protein [Candidatus Omnitrophota bacterium]
MSKRNYKGLLRGLGVVFIGISLCGCAALIIGGAVGALGGYAISKDTIQGETSKDFDSLMFSAKSVLEMMDAYNVDELPYGVIRARIGKTRATITITQLTSTTSRIKVKCRRYIFPNIELSEKLYVRIVENAR